MRAIIGTRKVLFNGKEYRTIFHIESDQLRMLPYSFVQSEIIKDSEWCHSRQLIIDRFNINLKFTKIDGRTKEAKKLPYFSWSLLNEVQFCMCGKIMKQHAKNYFNCECGRSRITANN